MKNFYTVATIIVTYNRSDFILNCLNAVLQQTTYNLRIYIINNASTDNTEDIIVKNNFLLLENIFYFKLDKNIGGAGGFSFGLKKAFADGCEWFWLLDDDCIVDKNSLDFLITPVQSINNIGFVCSHVSWSDGSPHFMNLPNIRITTNTLPFNYYSDRNLFIVRSCSFVSVLISRIAIDVCGLPLKEMFIWGDDMEFTSRIVKKGFIGLYSPLSHVTHYTKYNLNDQQALFLCKDYKKIFFSVRNNMFLARKTSYYKYIILFLKNLFISIKFLKIDYKIFFIYIKAILLSINFYPQIEFPSSDDTRENF